MEKRLIDRLASETPEESRILGGEMLDKRIYTAGEDFVVNESRLQGGPHGISVRTHTRFAPFPKHKHNYVEMMIVLSGKITHCIGGNTVTLGEGEVLLMNKHVSHSVEEAGRLDLGVNIIMSDGFLGTVAPDLSGTVFSSLFKENGKSDGVPMYLYFSTGEQRRHGNLIENLLLELTCERPDRGIMAKTVALLLYSLSKDTDSLLGGSAPSDKESRRIMDIQGYIKDNYRTASLSELCERLYLTPPYLSKLIKEYFGKSFKELVIEARTDRARELFLDTDLPVGEIIRSVGYENESYFHRVFRTRFGTSPLGMRKKAARERPDT